MKELMKPSQLLILLAAIAFMTGCGHIWGGITQIGGIGGARAPASFASSTTLGTAGGGSQTGTGAGGWKMMGSIGTPFSGVYTTSSGWTIYGSVQGTINSNSSSN